jgi:hypothetical protein
MFFLAMRADLFKTVPEGLTVYDFEGWSGTPEAFVKGLGAFVEKGLVHSLDEPFTRGLEKMDEGRTKDVSESSSDKGSSRGTKRTGNSGTETDARGTDDRLEGGTWKFKRHTRFTPRLNSRG